MKRISIAFFTPEKSFRDPIFHAAVCALVGCCITFSSFAQRPFIRLQQPVQTSLTVHDSVQYISGATCKACRLTLQDTPIKVYATGGFAARVLLHVGDNLIVLQAHSPDGQVHKLQLAYRYEPPQPLVVNNFAIARMYLHPDATSWLQPGDLIHIKLLAQAGCKAFWIHHLPLTEMVDQKDSLVGIYEGMYRISDSDRLSGPIPITLQNAAGETITAYTPYAFYNWPATPVIGKTIGERPFMQYSLGTDRLGAAKRSYLDTGIQMQVDGQFGNFYRVKLAPDQHAYVPVENLELLPDGTSVPHAVLGNWKVWGDSLFDYVQIQVGKPLPYDVHLYDHPGQIVIRLYGAVSNTNWISQFLSAEEIKDVQIHTLSDGVVEVRISLQHAQPWGCTLQYAGSVLLVRVKRQPKILNLTHLRIAIDAGHGGNNTGATGPTGTREKNLTLMLAEELQKALHRLGVHTIMTRTNDTSLTMLERENYLRQADPDLLLSIHLNSSSNPVDISGTSTYYHEPGFRPLSLAIYKRLVATGLQEFGNVGNFNFALNGMTDFPNALIEVAFISNPADEARILDPAFREKIIHAMVSGLKDFLEQCKK